jgi:hypothetical protein
LASRCDDESLSTSIAIVSVNSFESAGKSPARRM